MSTIPNIIGKKLYPCDNSYSFTIGSEKKPKLAGWFPRNGKHTRKRVTIVSQPYMLKIYCEATLRDWRVQMVTVQHGGNLHVMRNVFSETKNGLPNHKLTGSK